MKLSVCMITYNHENYLLEAIEGILMQKTDFDLELVIANDNSPDNTNLIIEELVKNHKEGHKIKYLNNKVNLGMMPNFVNAIKNCTGKYIALCEGDDYWIDENKLQKQVDFLDQNDDYSICYHKVNLNENDLITEDTITLEVNQTTTIQDLANGNYIHTCSVVYRNFLFDKFPEYFYIAPVGDYFLHLLNSQFGKIYCIDEKMAIYRVHNTSYWSSKSQKTKTEIWINFLNEIKVYFNHEIKNILELQIKKYTDVNLPIPEQVKIKKTIPYYFRKIKKVFNFKKI